MANRLVSASATSSRLRSLQYRYRVTSGLDWKANTSSRSSRRNGRSTSRAVVIGRSGLNMPPILGDMTPDLSRIYSLSYQDTLLPREAEMSATLTHTVQVQAYYGTRRKLGHWTTGRRFA